mmetsp:Transcript_19096/g.34519  ORF Transcript_19096/g.34519 Transcript_19096/m.34519 type:complete len:495 (-) Transcript_19096:2921-4405(-)
MLSHDLHCIIRLLISHVQVNSGAPQASTFAGTDNLGHIKFAEEYLAMFHNLFWDVFSVQNSKFSENANVGVFQAKALLEERNKVIKVAKIRVVGDNIVNMIRVLDDFKPTSGSKAILLSLETCEADLLPSRHIVRQRRGRNCLAVFLEIDVTQGELRVVVDALEENLGCIVETLGETTISNGLDVGNIRPIDKHLKVSQIVNLSVGIDELGVQKILLEILSCHLEIGDELSVNLGLVGLIAHLHVFTSILGIDETDNRIGSHLLLQLRYTKLGPNRLLVDLVGEALGAVKVLHEVNKDTNGKDLHLDLLLLVRRVFGLGKFVVDAVGLLIKHVTLRHANEGNVLGIKVIQLVNVPGNTSVVSPNGSENEQVLKVLVIREVRSLQDDTFEEDDELPGKICGHESLHRARNLVRGFALWKRPLNHLVDELSALRLLLHISPAIFGRLVLGEDLRPQLQVLTLNKIPCKVTEQPMGETNLDKLVITFSSTLLVRNEC